MSQSPPPHSGCHRATIPSLPKKTPTAHWASLTGPSSAPSSLTCANHSGPTPRPHKTPPSSCSTWFSGTAQVIAPAWESSLSEGPTPTRVFPPNPQDLASWSLWPGSYHPKRQRDPQVKHSHRKKRAVRAPLLVGTDTAAARHRHQGHLSLGPFLLQTVPGT